MTEEQFKIPFLHQTQRSKSDASFVDMIRNRICPNFTLLSISTIFIFVLIFVFVSSRLMYQPGGYVRFLQHPRQMDNWGLNIPLIRSNKTYCYQLVTSLFLCHSYRHLVTVLIFAFYIMYEMEFCWRFSIALGLFAGVVTNSVVVATLEGIPMGPSGMLCAMVGIQLAATLMHCSYLRETKGKQFYIVTIFGILSFVMIAGLVSIALMNFVGFGFGILYGYAFYPRLPQASINENITKVLKIVAIGLSVLALLLSVLI